MGLWGPRGCSIMGRYGQWDGVVRARVLKHEVGWLWQGGPRGSNPQGGMQDPQLGVLKGGPSR